MGYLDQKITCSLKYLFVGALCILFSFINTENLYLNLAIAHHLHFPHPDQQLQAVRPERGPDRR